MHLRREHTLSASLVLGAGLLALVLSLPRIIAAQPAGPPPAASTQAVATTGGGGPLGPSFPISLATGDAVHPAVAYNSQREEYVVVWSNDRPLYDDIYGRRLTREGELLPWFAIVWGAYERRQPAVAYNSQDDEYMVVYADSDNWEIGGARFPATGGAASSFYGFTTDGYSSTAYYDQPAIAYNPNQGVYLLAFRYINETGSPAGSKVDARGVTSDGSGILPGVFSIEGYSTSRQPAHPDVAYNGARDEFLVVWQRTDGTDDVYGQRAKYDSPTMTLVSTPFPIFTSTTHNESTPVVAALPSGSDGQYLVVCSRESGGTWWEIVAQRVTGQGGLDGPPIVVATGSGTRKDNPAVAANPSAGRYLVAWRWGAATIHERAVSAGGQLLGDEASISGSSLALADHPAVAGGPPGDFFVAFQDVPPSTGDWDIYGHLWGLRVYLPLVLRSGI